MKAQNTSQNEGTHQHSRPCTSLLNHNQRLILSMRRGILPVLIIDEFIIGRDSQNIIDLAPFSDQESGVSRHHAKLWRGSNDRLLIMDLDSTNGTFINEDPLASYRVYTLDNGDVLRLGRLIIHIQFEDMANII